MSIIFVTISIQGVINAMYLMINTTGNWFTLTLSRLFVTSFVLIITCIIRTYFRLFVRFFFKFVNLCNKAKKEQ